jgi:site-specific DNA recombinase
MVWASSDAKAKENFQKLVFPNGVRYNKEKGSFRTEKVNMILTKSQAWRMFQMIIKIGKVE